MVLCFHKNPLFTKTIVCIGIMLLSKISLYRFFCYYFKLSSTLLCTEDYSESVACEHDWLDQVEL